MLKEAGLTLSVPHLRGLSIDGNYNTACTNQLKGWIRRAVDAFLAQYSSYVQHEVGFSAIHLLRPTNHRTNQSSGHHHHHHHHNHHHPSTQKQQTHQPKPVRFHHSQQTASTWGSNDPRIVEAGPRFYALFHRFVYLAGVHILEVFVRHSHIYVRLGTIELSRFNKPASRTITTGPVSADVISQAALSAVTSMLTVFQDTVFRSNRRPVAMNSLPRNISSWAESGRLCDYTHVHSFSYDFYLRAVEEYLAAQIAPQTMRPKLEGHRKTVRFGRKSSVTTAGNNYVAACPSLPVTSTSGVSADIESFIIGAIDFPVTDFLSDLVVLARQPPVFARGCLRRLHISCPISQFLRPEQVFRHLTTEDHQCEDFKVIRMNHDLVSNHANDPSLPPQALAVVEQHLVAEPVASTRNANQLLRQSSHPTLLDSFLFKDPVQVDANTGSSIENNAYSSGSTNSGTQSPFPRLDYSVTGIFTHQHSDADLDCRGAQQLQLTAYVLITDPKHVYPASQLTSLHQEPSLRSRLSLVKMGQPVEWPAVTASLNLEAEITPKSPSVPSRLPPQLSVCIDKTVDTLGALRLSFAAFCRNRYISFSLDNDHSMLLRGTDSSTSTVDTSSSGSLAGAKGSVPSSPPQVVVDDLRWHISYLATWPAHQAPLHSVLLSVQSHLGQRITRLVHRSGVDFHKNLLWYRLFDLHHQQLGQSEEATASDAHGTVATVSHGRSSTCGLTTEDVKELIDSALFRLNLLNIDMDLSTILQSGARHFHGAVELLNGTNDYNRESSSTRNMFAAMFSTTKRIPRKRHHHYILLISLSFYDGFILLAYDTEADSPASNPTDRQPLTAPGDTVENIQLYALFRKVGQKSSTTADCGQSNPEAAQHLVSHTFFHESGLPDVLATFVNKLNYCVWRRLHSN